MQSKKVLADIAPKELTEANIKEVMKTYPCEHTEIKKMEIQIWELFRTKTS
jgi:hypothetical protein